MPSGRGSGKAAPEAAAPGRRPGRPPQSEGAETRRHILEVATHCFLRSGYDGTSMQAIAEEAGLTRTALYNYFRSRADLARAVLFEHATESAGRGSVTIGASMPHGTGCRRGSSCAGCCGPAWTTPCARSRWAMST